ncbi:MAG: mercuric reductase [Planctomycetota bacterium]|nr:MAG: mercuric reductase [Planctomycetota bacterium]
MSTVTARTIDQPWAADVEPLDEFNRRLLAATHPPDWRNPTPPGRYNMVVIGAGTAGLVTAAGAAGLGARVALVERRLMGGDCLNFGCVPSKALIRSARAIADVRRAGDFGVQVPDGVQVDFGAVMERMRRLRAKIAPHDSAERFRELGVDVFIGDGRFTGPDTVEVQGQTLRFARACVATGARPVVPPIPGLIESGFVTNETVFSLTELPRRLALLGAGPIGCELSQSFARFGAQVHLIDLAPQMLGREDRDAAEIVQASLIADGVRLVLGAKVSRVARSGAGKTLTVESPDGAREIEVDEILVGVGRAPNVAGIGLEAAGIAFDERSGVKVNDRLQTTNPRIYAAGDVCFPYKFTHVADAMARIVIRNALFRGRAKASNLTIPWCTYTDPEVAHVGLYEHEAQRRGIVTAKYEIPLSGIDRAMLDGDAAGFLKVIVRKGTDRILGATLVARHAGEMISEITALMAAGGGLKTLSATIHPYPTQADVFRRAGDAFARTGLTPFAKKLLSKVLAWQR